MKEEAFLEYINQLLSTGEVAGLFTRDELDTVITDMRPVLKRERPGASAKLGCCAVMAQGGASGWQPCRELQLSGL